MELKDKVAIVTGGSRGIGAAIARRFIQEQAAGVAIWDYDRELAEQTAAALGSRAGQPRCGRPLRRILRRAGGGGHRRHAGRLRPHRYSGQ